MITLRKLTFNDVQPFYTWINDSDVIRYSLSLFKTLESESEINEWFRDLLRSKDLNYGIVLKSTGKLIGYAGLCKISKTNKSAEYFIFIGEKSLWGKGIGKEVTEKILQIGFMEYKLHRIMLTVSEYNTGGQKAYKRTGFLEEGRMREATFRDGRYHDKIIMSVLKPDWLKNNSSRQSP